MAHSRSFVPAYEEALDDIRERDAREAAKREELRREEDKWTRRARLNNLQTLSRAEARMKKSAPSFPGMMKSAKR